MNWTYPRWICVISVTSLCLLAGSAAGGKDQVWASGRHLRSSQRALVVSSTAGALRSVSAGGTEAALDETRAALQADSSSSDPAPIGPSKCPGKCTEFGTCNEELGRCDCPLGRNGTDCSAAAPEADMAQLCARFGHTLSTCTRMDIAACVNGCNFRGRCLGGFCHCRPGFFGADCSLSLAPEAAAAAAGGSGGAAAAAPVAVTAAVEILAGQGYTVRPSGPRIYVYELPPEINVYGNLERLDRPLMYMIWQRLLSGGVRTADPATADFFFVPVRVRLSYDSERVVQAVKYIRETWPHWDSQPGGPGDRHLFVHTGDWGRDELSEEGQLLTRNATWLTHWGLARDHEFAGWKASHRPGRDIVLPLVLQASLLSSYRMSRTCPLHPKAPKKSRVRTLFFAGRVCGSRAQPTTNGSYPNCPDVLGKEDAYSAATRQQAFFHHHNRTNWKMVTKSRSYALDMLTSKFCLAPSGGGTGKRSIISVLMGCVPVTVTDGLLQPFEPELRWDRFAIDVRERDIPIMHDLLQNLKTDQVSEFQSNLRCAAQHLFWSSLYGSVFGEDGRYDAFETLLQILRMRATYPSLAPEEYAYVDAAFSAYMKCEDPPAVAGAGGVIAGGAGASGAAGVGSGSGSGIGGGEGVLMVGGIGRTKGTGDAGGLLDVAKPGLGQSLAGKGVGGGGMLPPPQLRPRPAGAKQELCSHSELPTDSIGSCNRCARRRGRLLNPGGTICCNTKELAKCPRLWD